MKQENQTFEEYLMEKYPMLFHVDESGNVLPPDCGISCPEGWRPIVDTLCATINGYVEGTTLYKQKRVWWFVVKKLIFNWVFGKRFSALINFIDPAPSKGLRLASWNEEIRNQFPKRKKLMNLLRRFRTRLIPVMSFNESRVPRVYIGQIKSKFGGLRFYYDGGDDVVAGMVRLAEALCNNTCETTGERGELYKKSVWYATVSKSFAQEQNMEKV